jgi:type IV fimbrial biogenesis protein FimT
MPVGCKKPYGVTLIELMVTLAVAAILVAAATPSLVAFIDKNRLKGVAEGVVDVINDARAESVKEGRDVNVMFKGTTSAWCVGANVAAEPTPGEMVQAASACDCTSSSSCYVGGQRKVFETTDIQGVTLSAVPASSFIFDARLGTVQTFSTPAAVTLTSPKQKFSLRLNLSPLGQASLCVPSGQLPVAGYSSC